MELKYVQPGEKVTATGYNAVVDAIGSGNNSSEGFMNTGTGTVFWPRHHLSTKYFNGAWRTMFQIVAARYWVQTTRGQWDPPNLQQTLLIDLGPDAATCKANVTVMGQSIEDAAVIVGDSPSMDSLIEDGLYVNASDKRTSWVDLGIKAEETDFVAGDIFKQVTEEGEGDEKKQVTKYYFAVTDKSESDVIDRAKQIFQIDGDGDKFTLEKRFILTKKGEVGIEDVQTPIQAHTGAISWSKPQSDDLISVDSELSDLQLSSLEKLSVDIQISSGISGEVEHIKGQSYSFWNFEKGERLTLGEALDKEKGDGKSAPSCRVDVVLRIGKATSEISAPTQVDYLELSTLVTSCDTDFYKKDPKEMKSTSLEWTFAEKGAPALQLKGFKDEAAGNPPEKYDLLARQTTDEDEKILKYVNPTDMVLVDNDISSLDRNSLEKKTDPEDADKKFIQLYNFDEPGDTVLSVDKYTHQLPDGYKLVVRHEKSGDDDNSIDIEYCDLSIDVQNMSADSEFKDKTKSIDADRIDNFFSLHNFSTAGTNATFKPSISNSYLLPDNGKELLYRDGKELKYCNADFTDLVNDTLSGAAKLYKADSEFPDEQLSSLERRENTEDDPDHPDKKLKRQEFSMYKFNQADYKMSRSEILDDSTVLVREKLTGGQTILRYVDLSSFEKTISGDVDIDQDGQKQKSIEFKETNDNNKTKYAQLHNFESTTADVKLNISEQEPESGEKYHFLVKKVSDGKLNELQYAEVSAVLSATVDDKSIEVNEDNNKLQLKYFDDDSYNNITLSSGEWFDKEGKQCLVGKNLETGEVNYYNFKVDLSANQLCVDTEVRQDGNYATQSIDEAYSTEDKVTYHRLHNFDLNQAADKDDWNDEMHVLIRKKEDSNLELDYIKLSDLSGAQVSVDTDGTTGKKSINHNSKDELQVYNFENGRQDLTGTFQDNGMLPDGFDVLVRSEGEIHYASLSVDHSGLSNGLSALSANLKADSEVNSLGLSSIERITWEDDDGKSRKAYSLYKFNDDEKVALEELNQTTDALLVKTGTGNKTLKYLDLSCLSSTAISVDSEGETGKSSIGKNSVGELQIHNFENATTDLTAGFVNDGKLPDEIQVLVKYEDEIHYANLSIDGGAISTDTEYSDTSKSIEQQDDGIIKINGFDTKANKTVSEVSSYADDYDVLMRHQNGGAYETEYINIAPLLSAGEKISCDSEGSTGKSSISKNSNGELQVYNFDSGVTDLTAHFNDGGKLTSDVHVLVRYDNDIHYATLSVQPICADTDFSGRHSKSMEVDAGGIKINGWDEKTAKEADEVSAAAAQYDVLMRHQNGNDYETEFINVAALLSTGVAISCDSQGTTAKKSIAYNSNGELQLYNFNSTGTDLTVSHEAGGLTPSNRLVLVKNTSNGTLQYARLYNNVRTDTSCDTYSNSIEYNTSYNAIKINGWNTKSNTAASTVSANVGNYDVLMRRRSGNYYYTEYMNVAPLLSGAQPKGETTDLTVITQVVWENYKIQPKGRVLKFVNGILSSVGEVQNVGGISTTPWTGE